MNTNKKSHLHRTPFYRRPPVIITFFAIIAIVAAITFAIFCLNRPKTTPSEQTPPGESIPTPTDEQSSDNPESEDDSWDNSPVQYEGEDVNDSSSLTGYITYKSINQGVLNIGTVIDQYLNTGGTCTLVLRSYNNTEVYRDTVDAFGDISASACDTFSVPITQLSAGTYQIEITLSGDNKNGIITGEVEL